MVIITTKTGKAGQGGTFEYNSSLSYSTPAKKFDLLGREDYLDAITQFGGDANALDFGNNVDWQDYIFSDAASQNQNLAYSNNYGTGFVRASFGYGKQFGIIEKSAQERITGRINASQRFFDDKLKIDVNATISRVNDEQPFVTNTSGSTGDLIGAAYFANPTWPTSPSFSFGTNLIPSQLLAYYQMRRKPIEFF